jgi:hypothetical protein
MIADIYVAPSDAVIGPQKGVRPAIGGWLAAREPVWDGEGWGCDRIAWLVNSW